MEEAWELAVVKDFFPPIFRKHFYRLTIGTIALLISATILFGHDIGAVSDFLSNPQVQLRFVAYLLLAFWAVVFGRYTFDVFTRSSSTERELFDDDVERKISNIQNEIDTSTDVEEIKSLDAQVEKLKLDLEKSYFENLRNEQGELKNDWREALMMSRRRLISESVRLGKRSRINLTWGMFGSLNAIALAGFFVLSSYSSNLGDALSTDWVAYLIHFTPKITLVLILQILAGFFLRNFLVTESELQRNKNEITNLELRLVAGMMNQESKPKLGDLAKLIASEERNFIISRKEKTSFSSGSQVVQKLESILAAIKP